MKISILISVGILVAGGGYGLQLKAKLSELQRKNPEASKTSTGFSRPRAESEASVKLAPFLQRYASLQDQTLSLQDEQEWIELNASFWSSLSVLTPSELQSAIELVDNSELGDTSKSRAMVLLMATLIDQDPVRGLSMLLEKPDFFESELIQVQFMAEAMELFGERDPHGAIHWFESSSIGKLEYREGLGSTLLSTLAAVDVELAVAKLDQLDLEDPDQHLPSIARGISHPESAGVYLRHLASRDLAKEESEKAALNLLEPPFLQHVDFIVKHLEEGRFGKSENLFSKLSINSHAISNQRPWLEYLQHLSPTESSLSTTARLISDWCSRNSEQSGKWLRQQPDSITKLHMVQEYAETLVYSEPDSAAEWAETLPAGERRTETFQRIYHSWKNDDQAAADSFAEKWSIDTTEVESDLSDFESDFLLSEGLTAPSQ